MNKSELVQNKIFDSEGLEKIIALWRFHEKKIIFTNGCFDLLHLGHVDYLAKAASLGDKLIVGLNTDKSVSKNKGPLRPINNEHSRAHILASLFFVDGVILFDEETPLNLIKLIQPDVLVKGGDYEIEKIVGYDIVKKRGGEVLTVDIVQGYSTTAIEEKIINSRK